MRGNSEVHWVEGKTYGGIGGMEGWREERRQDLHRGGEHPTRNREKKRGKKKLTMS